MPVSQPHRIGAEFCRDRVSEFLVNQRDVAVVFSDRDSGPDLRSAREIDSRLLRKPGTACSRSMMCSYRCRLVRVLQYKRRIQSVADELDIERRVVPVILNGLQFEQCKGDLIVDDLQIGAILRRQALRIY